MKKTGFITYIFGITIAVIVFCLNITKAQQQGELRLKITGGFITIAGSGESNIGSIISNPIEEYRILTIADILQIEDISGLCGNYYTTIQFSNLINGTDIIDNSNIGLNLSNITTIAGISNSTLLLGNPIFNQTGNINNPQTYINRGSGYNCGYVGQYGSTGFINIKIPANQPTGTYRGKIYYLLIDNN